MTKVLGIANFGLLDKVVCQNGELLTDDDFTLTDILLPPEFLGRVATGKDAERQRTHTGLSWPIEAKIHADGVHALRRAPLPVLWRALVERGDRFAAWKTNDGTDFSIGSMLAQSAYDVYSQSEKRLAALDDNDLPDIIPTRPQAVIAIPNTLDETGQEVFLRECVGLGMPEPYLIWRPVAAALAWLQHTEKELQALTEEGQHNDHIHVLYFGVDALEFTTLRLRRYMHNNKAYILPLRDRPLGVPQLAGMDWAGNIIETLCEANDLGAYWQLFTTFPEVWQTIAGKPFCANALPRPWSTSRGWQLWNPGDMGEVIQNAPASSSNMLQEIIKLSCGLKRYVYEATFPKQAAQEIEALIQSFPAKSLHGVIVCGPLAGSTMGNWLSTTLRPIVEKGIRQHSTRAQANAIWMSPGNTAIAAGSSIYGERRLAKIPAYLDTMPQMSLYTETQGKGKWHPLLNAQEVLGGQEFEDILAGKFELSCGRREFEIVLCKGPVPQEKDEMPSEAPYGLSTCQARLVRHWVRTQGKSYEAVQNKYSKLEQWARAYALEVAANIFPDGVKAREQIEAQPDEQETPFRNNFIRFPSVSEKRVVLDVHVNMKPAAGLARVAFVPRDKNFLDGRSIKMNYATMRPRFAPAKTQRAWPALLEIAAHPEDAALCREKNVQLVDEFEKVSPTASNYVTLITEIQNKCLKAPYKYSRGIMSFKALYPFTEKGICCTEDGDEQLCRIAEKLAQDFAVLLHKREEQAIERFLSRATWMYLATPKNIVDYIKTALTDSHMSPSMSNVLIESAGKCFQTKDDIKLLFEHIIRRAGHGKFTIQSLRSASRLLRYQENAPAALTEKTAHDMAQLTISLMEQEAQEHKYAQKFFQGVLLLLYLLRFRKVSDDFPPGDASSMATFDQGMPLIQQAIDYFVSKKNHGQTEKAKAALKDFADFVHQRATGSYPQAVLDLAGDEN